MPGAGMIKVEPGTSLPWLAYRGLRIDHQFYVRLVEQIVAAESSARFVLISGGMGTHIYSNLAKDLGLTAESVGEFARSQIHIIHEILKAYFASRGVSVAPEQVPVESLVGVLEEQDVKVVFAKPSAFHQSTDDLAADAARQIPADRLIIFKAQVPKYSVGFDGETNVTKWSLDDMIARARQYEQQSGSSYIITETALHIMSLCAYEVILRSPDAPKLLSQDSDLDFSTEVLR